MSEKYIATGRAIAFSKLLGCLLHVIWIEKDQLGYTKTQIIRKLMVKAKKSYDKQGYKNPGRNMTIFHQTIFDTFSYRCICPAIVAFTYFVIFVFNGAVERDSNKHKSTVKLISHNLCDLILYSSLKLNAFPILLGLKVFITIIG